MSINPMNFKDYRARLALADRKINGFCEKLSPSVMILGRTDCAKSIAAMPQQY
jgi:hypothetical protein